MFLLNWWREFRSIKNEHHCESCETLRMQLSLANEQNRVLLDRLLERPKEIVTTPSDGQPITLGKTMLPWKARQQMLEAEDRKRAQIISRRAESTEKISTEDLEKELDVVATERVENGHRT